METKIVKTKERIQASKSMLGVHKILPVNSSVRKQHFEDPNLGTGSCTLCDCPGFIPSTGGQTCINYNSAGGTCNHYASEHN